jgi:hypothetical protein
MILKSPLAGDDDLRCSSISHAPGLGLIRMVLFANLSQVTPILHQPCGNGTVKDKLATATRRDQASLREHPKMMWDRCHWERMAITQIPTEQRLTALSDMGVNAQAGRRYWRGVAAAAGWSSLQCIFYHQGPWHGYGTPNQPFHRGIHMAAAYGGRELPARSNFLFHSTHESRGLGMTQARIRGQWKNDKQMDGMYKTFEHRGLLLCGQSIGRKQRSQTFRDSHNHVSATSKLLVAQTFLRPFSNVFHELAEQNISDLRSYSH